MIALAAGVLVPVLSVLPYRRAGLDWARAGALALLAVLTAAVGAAAALVYAWFFTIAAAECGDLPTVAGVAAAVSYLVVGSWAALRPRRVWAWALAPGAGVSMLLLVSYFFAGAHNYCET